MSHVSLPPTCNQTTDQSEAERRSQGRSLHGYLPSEQEEKGKRSVGNSVCVCVSVCAC